MHEMPEIIAHRGLHREHTENTLAAFAQAIELGADGIELDVHATADGIVVVHHDASLGPPDSLPIASTPHASLARCKLAHGEHIPTLAEVLSLAAGVNTYVEVKAEGIEDAVAAAIARAPGRVAVHAFDHRVPAAVAATLPGLRRGILEASYLVDTAHALRTAGALDLWQHASSIDGHLVLAARAAGARVIAWTVNDPEEAIRLARLGVSALCTDECDVIRRALHDEGFRRG